MMGEWSLGFLSRNLFPDKSVWVERYKETLLERPLGGSGDSCVVSRLVVWATEKEEDGPNKRARSSGAGNDERQHRAQGSKIERRFVVKRVTGASARYGGFDSLKTEIKRISYKVEGWFLNALLDDDYGPAKFARAYYWDDSGRHTSLLIEQDLIAQGFPIHQGELDAREAKTAIRWLAQFHFAGGRVTGGRVWAR